jgi:outer membrane protein assembly factor BamB
MIRRSIGVFATLYGVAIVGLLAPAIGNTADWSRFRGPNGAAVSDASNIPTQWDERTNLAWKTPLPGPGSSSPIVVGDRVFLTCFTGAERSGNTQQLRRHLICVSLSDGKLLWDESVEAVQPEDRYGGMLAQHGFASSTPVSDGDRVYVLFGKTGVFAYDLNGKQLWHTSVGTGLGQMQWGSAASPILHNNLVIVNASAESKSMVALDKSTGKQAWKSEAPNIYGSRSTPVLVDAPNGKTELAVSAPYEVWGFNPDNGDFLWYADGVADQNVNTSLISKDGVVYAIGGRQGSAVAIKAGGKDDAKGNVVWKGSVSAYVPSPVLVGDRIYSVSDGVLTCISAKDGQRVYQKRLPSGGRNGTYGSPIAVKDKLYITTRTDGVLVAALEDGEVLAQNRLNDDSDFNASPAVADGKLLLRSDRALYCVSAAK